MPFTRRAGVLPGYGLSLGITLFTVCLMVLLPLTALIVKASGVDWSDFSTSITGPRARAAFALSVGASLAAALVNGVFGTLVAWVLVRYRFFGRRVLDALVDLPFALPTAVAGIALATVYGQDGWLGSLLEPHGISVAYTRLGVTVALVFVGLPFVVRTVEPVLHELDPKVEEAAATLGASRVATFFRVIFPTFAPALLTGVSLAFARGLGEYGSIIFISGNMPLRTEIVPLLIVTKLEQYDYAGATAVAVVMLAVSFALLLLVNLFQARVRRARGLR
ncbi:MAG: sulfate ABC transporter permease subunit CysT [Myxococcaceae bacterium]|nr:sulfate ABC transporter permease subunit CysT [Myxococcaceae bacterium]